MNQVAIVPPAKPGGQTPTRQGERKRSRSLWKSIRRDWILYLFLLPILLYYVVFKYLPMLWLVIGFQNYTIAGGVLHSQWVGFHYFQQVLTSPDFWKCFRNTLMLNVYRTIFGFPIPIILAILINEIGNLPFKRVSQTVLYMPHFISWVVVGGILTMILSPNSGVLNMALHFLFGIKPYYFLAHDFSWTVSYIATTIWKESGWGTIVYLAAVAGVDTELYESAKIDGAGKFKQIWHVTLPGIRSTIAIMLILHMGSMMSIGFEQIYALSNNAVLDVADVISTYTYRLGIQGMQYSYSTAVGMFDSVISLILILSTNKIVKALGESGLW